MQFSDYWNNVHSERFDKKIVYDNWLDKYKSVWENSKTPILDLGCGAGNDTLYFVEKGYSVVACDYSEVALEKIRKNIESAQTKLVDISQPLPFKDNSFDVVVADLSLHYFDEKTTKTIIEEINRILTPNGSLLARVNSVADINHGAGQGEKIEENFYFVEGYNKRFFTIEDARIFFSIIGDVRIIEADMLRYTKPKKVIEIVVKKEN